ncbi:MAG TPA: hypothetical protein VK858_16340 [Longimicrobiales bacterium]|nr:hypothetical protein [Longimicrobiales bacterium]
MSVVVAVGVVLLLLARPSLGLALTWDLLVPLVPLTLLVAPRLWRNLCPIAVVHQLPVRIGRGGRRRPGRAAQWWMSAASIGLLAIIVPLRLVVFNENGPALALFVVSVLVIALLGGAYYAGKAGWCASLCPVLPVERLYGQDPWGEPSHAHCSSCVGCVSACPDLDPRASFRKATGPNVLRTPMGLFALGFPGFVAGYFLADQPASLFAAYALTFGGAVISGVAFLGLIVLLRLDHGRVARLSAAVAFGVYYWFTVPSVAAMLAGAVGVAGLPTKGILAAQLGLIGLAFVWLTRGVRRPTRRTA